ncbi:hypothetical protein V2J09_017037 [Rumex salicifolius]
MLLIYCNHNHNLASPCKTHLFRTHRKISLSQSTKVDLADISGIAPMKAYEFMTRQAGGREHLGFTNVDYRNYQQSKCAMNMDPPEVGDILEAMSGKLPKTIFTDKMLLCQKRLLFNGQKLIIGYQLLGDSRYGELVSDFKSSQGRLYVGSTGSHIWSKFFYFHFLLLLYIILKLIWLNFIIKYFYMLNLIQ